MASITFDQFEVGLDLRKSASTSEPGRLRALSNAYITKGRVIRKRPGLEHVATLEAGTVGLVSGLGALNTFQQYGGGVVHADTRFVANTLAHTVAAAYGSALTKIEMADIFNATIYLSATFADGATFHHYLDTTGAPPTGKFWNLASPTVAYYVWYTVDGVGTDPAPAGRTAIVVAVLSDDTPAQVATKTQVVLEAHAAFTATVSGDVVTVTNSVTGGASNATAQTSGVTIAITTQGAVGIAEVTDVTFTYTVATLGATRVTSASCPHNKTFIKAASRIFSPSTVGTVRYTRLEQPRDWTYSGGTAVNAGYLPTGIHSKGNDDALALGQYEGKLAVFFVDALQMWAIDQDVTNNAFDKTIDGLGTEHPRSPVVFAGDLLFLAKSGFRSVSTQNQAQNLTDNDVGSPIDTLVQPEISSTTDPIGLYFSSLNQYWCLYPIAGTSETRVWVLSFSKSAKVSAWAEYTIPLVVDAATNHGGDLYLRSGDSVFRVVEPGAVYTDNNQVYEMRAEFPFLDFKKPGADKYISAMDLVVTGEVQVQFRFDPNNPEAITDPITLSGNTRGGQRIPIEMTLAAIAPVFTSSSGDLVQIDAMTFYYDVLE